MRESISQPDATIQGAKYCFRNTNAGAGEIYNSSGSIVWRYRPPLSAWNFLNGPLRCPDFILFDPSERELLRIQREKRFPLPKFVMIENGSIVGSIKKQSFLSTDYAVHFTNGAKWRFQIPLFTVRFNGASENGAEIWVQLASELVWYVSIDARHDSAHLISSLAFIHSERCRK